MANNVINDPTKENTPKFTNEDIEKIREKLKKNNSKNLMGDSDGDSINAIGLEDLPIITLKDCVDIVNGFIEGKVSVEELEEFGNKMTIRSYIPLLEKMSILMKILTQHNLSTVESTEIRMAELYKDIFFTIVLGSYGLIKINENNSEDRELMSYENYDKLFPLFYQYILAFCKEDYNVFIDMFKDCINFNGIMDIIDSMQNVDAEALAQNTKANMNLVETLRENQDLVNNLKDVVLSTDNNVKQVASNIKKLATETVKATSSEDSNNANINIDKGDMKPRDIIEQNKIELEKKKMQLISSIQESQNTPKKKRGRPKKEKVINVDFTGDTNK